MFVTRLFNMGVSRLISITCLLLYVTVIDVEGKPTLDMFEGIAREFFHESYQQTTKYDSADRGSGRYPSSASFKQGDRSYKDICRTQQYDGFMNKMGVPKCPY